jgi:hypothetical protein
MNEYFYHAKALQWLQMSLGAGCPSITWNGQSYPLIPSSAIRRKDLDVGGFQLNADFRFNALVSTFGVNYSAQTLKDAMLQKTIIYLGDTYKVDSITLLPGGYQITADCSSINQNA